VVGFYNERINMAFENHNEFRWAGRPKPPIPAATQAEVKKRAGGKCEICGEPPGFGSRLELHHRHYETEGRERPDDLVACCRTCHLREHVDINGEFWCDPQERENYWSTFDNQCD
jgi:5-methylcytosine-specific restriction endonuclease McrA